MTITVVGGGATGVELAGTLAELRGTVLGATFPDVDPSRVHVRLVEMAPCAARPVQREAARVRPGPAGQARRRHQAEHGDRRGHRRPGAAGRRRGAAERPDRVGGRRGRRTGRRGLGAAAGQARPHAGRAGPAGHRAGPDLRGGRHRDQPGRAHAAARPAGPADGPACRGADRQAGWPGRPPSRSSTTTRARWPRSAAGRPWSSCRRPAADAARWPGWPGSRCTWCTCWAAGTGSPR